MKKGKWLELSLRNARILAKEEKKPEKKMEKAHVRTICEMLLVSKMYPAL